MSWFLSFFKSAEEPPLVSPVQKTRRQKALAQKSEEPLSEAEQKARANLLFASVPSARDSVDSFTDVYVQQKGTQTLNSTSNSSSSPPPLPDRSHDKLVRKHVHIQESDAQKSPTKTKKKEKSEKRASESERMSERTDKEKEKRSSKKKRSPVKERTPLFTTMVTAVQPILDAPDAPDQVIPFNEPKVTALAVDDVDAPDVLALQKEVERKEAQRPQMEREEEERKRKNEAVRAEQERLARERKEEEERERKEEEARRLERERKAEEERKATEKREAERREALRVEQVEREREEQKEKEKREREQREKREREQREERERRDREQREERERRDREQREEREKREQEQREERERKEREEQEEREKTEREKAAEQRRREAEARQRAKQEALDASRRARQEQELREAKEAEKRAAEEALRAEETRLLEEKKRAARQLAEQEEAERWERERQERKAQRKAKREQERRQRELAEREDAEKAAATRSSKRENEGKREASTTAVERRIESCGLSHAVCLLDSDACAQLATVVKRLGNGATLKEASEAANRAAVILVIGAPEQSRVSMRIDDETDIVVKRLDDGRHVGVLAAQRARHGEVLVRVDDNVVRKVPYASSAGAPSLSRSRIVQVRDSGGGAQVQCDRKAHVVVEVRDVHGNALTSLGAHRLGVRFLGYGEEAESVVSGEGTALINGQFVVSVLPRRAGVRTLNVTLDGVDLPGASGNPLDVTVTLSEKQERDALDALCSDAACREWAQHSTARVTPSPSSGRVIHCDDEVCVHVQVRRCDGSRVLLPRASALSKAAAARTRLTCALARELDGEISGEPVHFQRTAGTFVGECAQVFPSARQSARADYVFSGALASPGVYRVIVRLGERVLPLAAIMVRVESAIVSDVEKVAEDVEVKEREEVEEREEKSAVERVTEKRVEKLEDEKGVEKKERDEEKMEKKEENKNEVEAKKKEEERVEEKKVEEKKVEEKKVEVRGGGEKPINDSTSKKVSFEPVQRAWQPITPVRLGYDEGDDSEEDGAYVYTGLSFATGGEIQGVSNVSGVRIGYDSEEEAY